MSGPTGSSDVQCPLGPQQAGRACCINCINLWNSAVFSGVDRPDESSGAQRGRGASSEELSTSVGGPVVCADPGASDGAADPGRREGTIIMALGGNLLLFKVSYPPLPEEPVKS